MSARIAQAISALRQALPHAHLVTPDAKEEYQALSNSYLSGFESDLSPACIFLPKFKEEVAAFVRTIGPFADDVQFAIRAAGRQPLPGCANVQDGITVDLRSMTGIDLQDGQVQVAAGGLSFYSSREGFICDNVINFEVVVASGEILNANAKENSDLWVALRGGGNNLGIVTRFDFRTFKQGPMYAGMVWYFKQSFPDQMAALVKELTSSNPSVETHLMLSIAYAQVFGNGDDVICLNQLYYTQPVEDPPVLAPFVHVQPQRSEMNSMKIQTLVEAATEQSDAGQSKIRCLYMNVCVKADVDTLTTGGDIWCEELEPVKDASGLMCSYTLQPYPVSQLQRTSANGGNVLGLDPSNGPVINVLLLSYWADKKDDARVISFMQKALKRIERNADDRGQLVPFIYWNYAFSDQDALRSYGEENVQKLQAASKKYDPDGVFQTACPGGFKLF
ncbi:FAD-binding domain-containing protein [Apiospora rasikravindrae]|uniref:FAD-binding domain-containing protein n=1 Tax=Apiospora rasikravindrae TaxID=990691 RepID=A0ABR1TFY3_9PEZI